ncbi:MAG: HK97 gp10 family phage protein [Methanosarcinales archaeon]|jgi:hypothetical protein|nr:HK97 gp10 family phage protein [Methanosarcinales archaeon]
MASWGTVDIKQLIKLRDGVAETNDVVDEFMRAVAKEFATRFLRLVVKGTPVGIYPSGSGKTGGTLRRGWTAQQSGSVSRFVDSLSIRFDGENYTVEIVNDVDYASYVEFGHRTPNGKGWVSGRFMMTKSEIIANREFPKIAEKKMLEFLKRQMKNG